MYINYDISEFRKYRRSTNADIIWKRDKAGSLYIGIPSTHLSGFAVGTIGGMLCEDNGKYGLNVVWRTWIRKTFKEQNGFLSPNHHCDACYNGFSHAFTFLAKFYYKADLKTLFRDLFGRLTITKAVYENVLETANGIRNNAIRNPSYRAWAKLDNLWFGDYPAGLNRFGNPDLNKLTLGDLITHHNSLISGSYVFISALKRDAYSSIEYALDADIFDTPRSNIVYPKPPEVPIAIGYEDGITKAKGNRSVLLWGFPITNNTPAFFYIALIAKYLISNAIRHRLRDELALCYGYGVLLHNFVDTRRIVIALEIPNEYLSKTIDELLRIIMPNDINHLFTDKAVLNAHTTASSEWLLSADNPLIRFKELMHITVPTLYDTDIYPFPYRKDTERIREDVTTFVRNTFDRNSGVRVIESY